MESLGEAASSPLPGWVIWITGLAGAGKTTLGHAVVARLRERSDAVVLLDADAFREAMGGDLGYTLEDRLANARRVCRMARLMAGQGIHVVVATISLFHECHEWNRANQPRYFEVFLDVSEETLDARNQHGLRDAHAKDVMGRDQRAQLPESPDLVIDGRGAGEDSPDRVAERIVGSLRDV